MVRNYYIERKTLEAFKDELKDIELQFCAIDNNNIKEMQLLDAKRGDLIYSMNDIYNTINTKFHVNVDGKFRCFNDTEFDIPIRLGDVNYIVGPNGSGKSTILQTIRAWKDSLYEINKKELDGMTSQNIKFLKGSPMSITGVHSNYTSKMCPICGCIDDGNRTTQEDFRCVECGHEDNADHNAAVNIRNRVGTTVLCKRLLKQLGNGAYEPRKMSKDKVKDVLLSYRTSLGKDGESEFY